MANETFDYCQAFFEHEKTDQVLWQLLELFSYLICIACYQKYNNFSEEMELTFSNSYAINISDCYE